MPTLVNLAFNLADLVGSDFDPRRTKIWLEANVDTIIDTTGKQIRLGDVKATVGDDGTGSFVGLIATNSTDVNPTGFLYRAQIDYQPRSGGARTVWSSGWFALTASSDLALVTPVANAPATVTEDAVIASRAKDPGSATNAAIDEAVAGDVNDPASQMRGALNATFARLDDRRFADPSVAPLFATTAETAGSINAAPGARTGLSTTMHAVTAGDGVVNSQGYVAEHVAAGVSGTVGAYTLTVTDTTTLATLDGDGTAFWDAAVGSSDGRATTVTVLDVSGTTVTLLHPLPFTITAGTLSSRMDAVGGQHLTKLGYKALAQHVAAANPVFGTAGGRIEGVGDRTPPAARTLWSRNAALLAYGAISVNGISSNQFDQATSNASDTKGLYRRATTATGGTRFGTHRVGHGGIATIRTGRRRVAFAVCTGTAGPDGDIATAARIQVTATTPDGIVLHDKTVGGGLAWHRVVVPADLDYVTIEATNQGGGEYYLHLAHTYAREAGVGGRLAPRKVLLLGDSWTQFGDNILGTHLANTLGCQVATFGKGGTTTDWGIAWLDHALTQNPGCDTVVVHFYTNDLNNNQNTTMTIPSGATVSMWPNGLTTEQAEARWVTQIHKLVSMIQQRGLRPVVVMPGAVGATRQLPASVHLETPRLVDWSAASEEFTTATSYLNTVGKKAGAVVHDTTLAKPLWASGPAATDTWRDATGMVVHTPA